MRQAGPGPWREPSARLRAVLDDVPGLVAVLGGDDLVVVFANRRQEALTGIADVAGRPLAEVLGPALADPGMRGYVEQVRRVLRTGVTEQGWEAPARFLPDTDAVTYWDYALIALSEPGEAPGAVVVYATDVTRLVEARSRAAEAEHRFTSLFESNVIGVTISGADTIVEANDAFLQMVGRRREELAAGLPWPAMTAPESVEADARALATVRETGGVVPYEKVYLRPDGSRVPALVSGSLLQREPLRILATVYDLSARERAAARTTRLQEITAALSATNAPEAIARAVVHQALEELSASAGVLVRGPADPQVAHAVGFPPQEVDEWRRFPATLPQPVTDALRTGDVAVAAGVPTVAAVPLEVTGRTLGALALAWREPHDLPADDREFLVSVARQAATALDRAQLYENRAYVARTLQQGLLPQRLPAVPGVDCSVVYESISGRGEVGGDFYDLFEASPGRYAVAVGDVAGKGTEAAVTTGIARHTVRAAARMCRTASGVLGFLNDALRRHADPPPFCTVCHAFVEAAGDGALAVQLASGGHPYPLVLRADGRLEQLEVRGTMLGVTQDPELEDRSLRLAPGDALVLYTDGVTDARRAGGERFGEDRLLDVLRAAPRGSAAAVADAVEAAVRAHITGTSADDRAILVLRATR